MGTVQKLRQQREGIQHWRHPASDDFLLFKYGQGGVQQLQVSLFDENQVRFPHLFLKPQETAPRVSQSANVLTAFIILQLPGSMLEARNRNVGGR